MVNKKQEYFAEHETDRILRERFFPNREVSGVMVEVGGGTPDFLSMSKHFHESGWRTVAVEPNPMFAEMHRKAKREVYECACGPEYQENVPFTIVTQNVEAYGGVVTDHSFSALTIKEGYRKLLPKTAREQEILVTVRRLDDILTSCGLKHVSLLSVDVEGWECEVISGIDFNKFKIDVIVLENFLHEEEQVRFMESVGYRLRFKIEYNYVYEPVSTS